MPIDPMTGAMLANAGIQLFSSIFGKKKKNVPQYQPQQYQAPPSMVQSMPEYASMFQQNMPQAYDPATGPVYQQLLQQMTSGSLPQAYRQQVLGQAQTEAENAYNAANSQLTFDEDRAMRGASERMNKLGLLSSGAHGVTQGLIGEGYGRQRGALAGNLQNQLGRASTGLMEQEMAQRDRIQSLLSGIEGQRQDASLQSRGQLLGFAQQDQANRMANAQNQYAAQAANAQNQYASQANQFNYGQDQRGKMLDSLQSLVSAYGLQSLVSAYGLPSLVSAYGMMQGGRRSQRSSR